MLRKPAGCLCIQHQQQTRPPSSETPFSNLHFQKLFCKCSKITNLFYSTSTRLQVPGNKAAIGQQYNICSDRCISFDGIVKAAASAAGQEADIVHYDPKKADLKKGEGFPFRTSHFFAQVEKAKADLGWQPQHDFLSDIKQLVEDYKSSGRLDKQMDFSADDKCIACAK